LAVCRPATRQTPRAKQSSPTWPDYDREPSGGHPYHPLPAEEEEEEQEFAVQPMQPQAATRATRGPIRVQLKTAAAVVVEAPTVYLFVDQIQRGPFTPPQIQQMFCDGAIPPDALYWQEGMGDWRSAQELRLN
jgi:hypothetical protein